MSAKFIQVIGKEIIGGEEEEGAQNTFSKLSSLFALNMVYCEKTRCVETRIAAPEMPFVLMAFWLAWSGLGNINLLPSWHLPLPQNWLFKEKLGRWTQTQKTKPGRRWDGIANFPPNQRLWSSPPGPYQCHSPLERGLPSLRREAAGKRITSERLATSCWCLSQSCCWGGCSWEHGRRSETDVKGNIVVGPRDGNTMKYSEVQGEDEE